MTPLVKFPDATVLLPPRYMGSVGYYAAMSRYGRVIVDSAMRYDKRCKDVHRCEIVDTRGVLRLTVPLGKPHGCDGVPTWNDAPVSTHDEWWRQHRIAFESAYGRTPYFEFLIDKFDRVFRSPAAWDVWPSAIDLDRLADGAIRSILGFDNMVEWGAVTGDNCAEATDLRHADFVLPSQPAYRQIRADRLGFHPNLSILDLIFNLGPESPLYLYALESSTVGCVDR